MLVRLMATIHFYPVISHDETIVILRTTNGRPYNFYYPLYKTRPDIAVRAG